MKRDWRKNHPIFEPCSIYCTGKSGIATIEDLLKKIPQNEIPYIPQRQ
jgi:hypothetical protein